MLWLVVPFVYMKYMKMRSRQAHVCLAFIMYMCEYLCY